VRDKDQVVRVYMELKELREPIIILWVSTYLWTHIRMQIYICIYVYIYMNIYVYILM